MRRWVSEQITHCCHCSLLAHFLPAFPFCWSRAPASVYTGAGKGFLLDLEQPRKLFSGQPDTPHSLPRHSLFYAPPIMAHALEMKYFSIKTLHPNQRWLQSLCPMCRASFLLTALCSVTETDPCSLSKPNQHVPSHIKCLIQPRSESPIVLGWGGEAGKGDGSCSGANGVQAYRGIPNVAWSSADCVLLLELKHALWITHSQKKR